MQGDHFTIPQTVEARHTERNEEVIEQRMALANEYNEIVRTAHLANPEIFPDGPYADIEELAGELRYCRMCLAKLPALVDGDVLHGHLNVSASIVDVPAISAAAAVKLVNAGGTTERRTLLVDARFKDQLAKLPAYDMSGSSPVLPGTHALREIFPTIVSDADVRSKKKFMLKDLVWTGWLGRDKLDGHTVVPLNYQQYDLRAENLQLLPGAPKEHKSPEGVPFIARGLGIDMLFWPRNVSLALTSGGSRKSPWVLYVRGEGPRKSFACSEVSIREVFTESVLPLLRSRDPEFDAINATYQRLLRD